jgi:hypothetical protein
MESKPALYLFVVSHFLHANRIVRLKRSSNPADRASLRTPVPPAFGIFRRATQSRWISAA